jgi:hypothetical protein
MFCEYLVNLLCSNIMLVFYVSLAPFMCILRYLWFGSAYLRSMKIRQKEVPQVSITVASKVIVNLIIIFKKGFKSFD